MSCPVHQHLSCQTVHHGLFLCLLLDLLDSFHLLEERKSPRLFALILNKDLIKHFRIVSDGLEQSLVFDSVAALCMYELAALTVGTEALLAEFAALLGFVFVG